MDKNKIILPPIQTLTTGMPILTLEAIPPFESPIIHEPPPIPCPMQKPQCFVPPQQYFFMAQPQKPKAITFTTAEDLTILKAMRLYLGKSVSLKVPWSFWQFYRKFSGSQRSDSSLYHHWNGAMVKKYGCFIKDGRIDDCIKWVESSLDYSKKGKSSQKKLEARSLIHTRSQQVLSMPYFVTEANEEDKEKGERQLTRFNSFK
jgi:hypothetical protein